jgi:two-component sensor histidine kinase
MILLEWFTNSGKYGAHSLPTGRVEVSWELADGPKKGPGAKANGDGAAGQIVRLRWRESGGPPVKQRTPPASLGTELVKGFASLELRGRFEAAYPRKGAEYLLEFPLEPHDADGFDAKSSAPIYVLPREAMTAVKGAAVPRTTLG